MALKARDIEKTKFKKSALGRRGYDEHEVDEFVGRVAREVARLNSTVKRLTQQMEFSDEKSLLSDNDYLAHRVSELEHRIAMYKSALGDAVTVESLRGEISKLQQENALLREETQHDVLGVSIRAVNMLSQAQITAETTVAEAEYYARELVAQARDQYADILRQAQKSAARAADGIASLKTPPAGAPEPLPAEIEYIRTYAQIAEKQMHTIVEALFAEIDKLGESKQPPVRAAAASPSPANKHDTAEMSFWNPQKLESAATSTKSDLDH